MENCRGSNMRHISTDYRVARMWRITHTECHLP